MVSGKSVFSLKHLAQKNCIPIWPSVGSVGWMEILSEAGTKDAVPDMSCCGQSLVEDQ